MTENNKTTLILVVVLCTVIFGLCLLFSLAIGPSGAFAYQLFGWTGYWVSYVVIYVVTIAMMYRFLKD